MNPNIFIGANNLDITLFIEFWKPRVYEQPVYLAYSRCRFNAFIEILDCLTTR